MRKKNNKRIFALCFAVLIISMLAVNASAYIHYSPDDQKMNIATPPFTLDEDNVMFQIPPAGSIKVALADLFPDGNYLDVYKLLHTPIIASWDIYIIGTQYADGSGGYTTYVQGYTIVNSDDPHPYTLIAESYEIEGGYVTINFGIRRGNTDEWFYTSNGVGEYEWTEQILCFWINDQTSGDRFPNHDLALKERLIDVLPITYSYTETQMTGEYDRGYQDGKADALNDMNNNAYDFGHEQGYAIGYTDGYNDNNDNNLFKQLMNAVIFTPIDSIMSILNFDLMGINVRGLITTIMTIMIVIAIIIIIWKKVT